jgi:hypothetical protein
MLTGKKESHDRKDIAANEGSTGHVYEVIAELLG